MGVAHTSICGTGITWKNSQHGKCERYNREGGLGPKPRFPLCCLEVTAPLSVSLRVNEHDNDDDDDGTDIHTITSNSSDCISLLCTVLCTGSFMYTVYTLSHLILTASLSSPFLS